MFAQHDFFRQLLSIYIYKNFSRKLDQGVQSGFPKIEGGELELLPLLPPKQNPDVHMYMYILHVPSSAPVCVHPERYATECECDSRARVPSTDCPNVKLTHSNAV